MTAQLDLFTAPRTPRRESARTVTSTDGERFTGQCGKILAMLQARPQLNNALAAVSLKYTSRVSDLRAAGYVIKCDRVAEGVTRYTLIGNRA